jgi:hypothetical protein
MKEIIKSINAENVSNIIGGEGVAVWVIKNSDH